MPPKRNRGNESIVPEVDSSSETLTYDTAQALIHRLMTQFDIDLTLLEDFAGMSNSFSLWNPAC
jgi:hypothetical protein